VRKLFAVLSVCVLTTGCTDSTPRALASQPSGPQISANVPPGMATPCNVANAAATFGAAEERDVITGAKVLVIGANNLRSTNVVLDDDPLTPKLDGFSGQDGFLLWLLEQASSVDPAVVVDEHRSSPKLAETDGFLNDLKRRGRYVGYVGGKRIDLPTTVTCDGVTTTGHLITWDKSTVGLLGCDQSVKDDSLAILARQYCQIG
jgi:hypothetical protein